MQADWHYNWHSLVMSANTSPPQTEAWPHLFLFLDFRDYLSSKGDFMKIRPLHDRVIVKRLDNERKTASGIVIPDSAAEKPDQGEIIAVGPGKRDDNGKLIPVDVKVGDKVLFGKYAGQTVKVEGEELLVMREEDLMGVVA
jgi:chaperonin GroES